MLEMLKSWTIRQIGNTQERSSTTFVKSNTIAMTSTLFLSIPVHCDVFRHRHRDRKGGKKHIWRIASIYEISHKNDVMLSAYHLAQQRCAIIPWSRIIDNKTAMTLDTHTLETPLSNDTADANIYASEAIHDCYRPIRLQPVSKIASSHHNNSLSSRLYIFFTSSP